MAHTNPIPRGSTFHGAAGTIDTNDLASVNLEGLRVEIPALDADGAPIEGKVLRATIVRNAKAGTLAPGHTVTWQADYRGRRVDAEAASGAEPAGIVDDQLGYSVRQGDLFLLIRRGLTRHKTHTTSASITAGDFLIAASAAGTLEKLTSANTNNLNEIKAVVGVATQNCATTANDASFRGIDVTIE